MLSRFFAPAVVPAVSLVALSLLLGAAGSEAEAAGTPSLSLPSHTVARYAHIEGTVSGVPSVDNPYDPRQVDVRVEVSGPSGRQHALPAFYWEGQRRDGDRVQPTGAKGWRFRYTPTQAGAYRLTAVLRQGDTVLRSAPVSLRVTPARNRGFVRRVAGNKRVLLFDSGEPYFAVGHNVCWASLTEYDDYWKSMAQAGENYTRIWMIHWNVALEWTGEGYQGLGRYSQPNAWKLDYLLDQAERRGIYVMLCLDSFNELRASPSYPAWEGNPYRKENGGPLTRPEQFFTDAEARRAFKQRLRYLVARYGHFRSLLAWEFWNEVDIIEKYVSSEVAAWHREMARELRALDPYRHLITTSYAGSAGDPAVDGLPEMDYVQTHNYGSRDMARMAQEWNERKLATYNKPHLIGEYGTGAMAEGLDSDPEGINLHNGIWASTFTGSLGTAALWWWDNYIKPRGLYTHFTPLAQFVRGVAWASPRLRTFQPRSVAFSKQAPRELVDAFILPPNVSWSAAPYNRPLTVSVPNRENQEPLAARLPGLLHGVRNHPDLHNPITFDLDVPEESEFIVQVGGVSGYGGAGLRITVDGEARVERDFPDTNREGRHETLQNYAGPYRVPLSRGRHRVVVENTGSDWMEAGYSITRYGIRDTPPLRAYGVWDGTSLHVWLQNADSTWYRHSLGKELKAIAPAKLTLPAPRGRYRLEWWDTYSGRRTPGGVVVAGTEGLVVTTPSVARDIALRATPIKATAARTRAGRPAGGRAPR